MKLHNLFIMTSVIGILLTVSGPISASVANFTSIPPTLSDGGDPNVLIDLSVEWPVISAAYGDNSPATCRGTDDGKTTSRCYDSSEEYIGYFDPDKCYTYQNARFEPTANTANHECSNAWSGNLLNWSTMSSLDIVRWTLTGGNRVVDDASVTVLERAVLDFHMNDGSGNFPVKKINDSTNVDPTTVMPNPVTDGGNTIAVGSASTIFITGNGTTIKVCTAADCSSSVVTLNAHVKVCDTSVLPSVSLESNCIQYPNGNYKPHGLIQNNSGKMRFGLMSYLLDTDVARDGGVLRAKMKYLGPLRPTSGGGLEANPNTEWAVDSGVFTANPDSTDATNSGVANSGLINYLNKFGANGYKSKDPVSEIYYECIRYFKGADLAVNPQTATTEYANNLTAAFKDGYPVITSWNDPIVHRCQDNFILAINDAFPHRDKQLPGTFFTSNSISNPGGTDVDLDAASAGADYGEPSNPDSTINVTTLTNTVGALENAAGGFDLSNFQVGCKPGGGNLSCDESCNNKGSANLGEVMGTCPPSGGRQNTYYIAGLAYYANTTDLRSDFGGDQTISTFMIDVMEYNSNPPLGAMNPLWLAGKYGGFDDIDGDSVPDAGEWDQDSDGEPDNYVLANDPANIVTGLLTAFSSITDRVNSGAAAAVIADTVSMTGAVVQALYQPRLSISGDVITWAGMLHSVFIDEYGNLREDTNQNGTLDVPATDKYIQIKYSTDLGRTQVYYCTSGDGGLTLTCPVADRKDIEDLQSLWNLRDRLADVPDSRITTQRTYTDPFLHSSSGGRHIITWLDNDSDNMVDSGETVAFTESSITGSNYGYLNASSEAEADNIVKFIRGKEGISGFRSRSIDFDGDNVKEAWRLGDIINSTPLIVSQPHQPWNLYGDQFTYNAFRTQYANRRHVVYVGANDGMLHAVNAGFFDVNNNRFCKNTTCTNPDNDTAHPLGAELWAYVPKNLLPHLGWLTDVGYPHVYYMDGKAQAFDVNIFAADSDHPYGWGTILVAGMRLGGGDLDVDSNSDATVDYTAKSGYVILDITNPEVAPKVLGEFTHAELGYTTSTPTLVVKRQPNATTLDWTEAGSGSLPNDWYLVFGSGPNVLTNVTSTQTAKLFMVKLKIDATSHTLDFATAGNVTILDTSIANSFVGDSVGVDWSSDFLSDAVYFGVAGGTPASPTGKLLRLKLDGNTAAAWTSWSPLIDSGQPFINKPELVSLDNSPYNDWWVYAGTGRLFTNADNTSTAQQSFYGIREAHDGTYPEDYPDMTFTVNTTDYTDTDYAQNVTGISVFADGSVTIPAALQSEFATVPTLFTELETHIDGKKGWFLNYSTSPVATRSLTRATFWRDFVLFTSYTPPADACTPEGYSDLYALYGATGTAHPTAGLNMTGTQTNNGVGDKLPSTYLSIGIASEITTYDTLKGTKPIIQMSTGEIVDTGELTGLGIGDGRQSWRELPF